MFKNWRQKERIDRIVLKYITKQAEPCSVIGLGNRIGVGRLYKSLVRLRRQGLIASIPGEQIAGGACDQLYFVKEVEK